MAGKEGPTAEEVVVVEAVEVATVATAAGKVIPPSPSLQK
jgi:hypothetical protein